MFTVLFCLAALGVVAASAIFSAKAMRKMDVLYDERARQD